MADLRAVAILPHRTKKLTNMDLLTIRPVEDESPLFSSRGQVRRRYRSETDRLSRASEDAVLNGRGKAY